MIEVTDNTVVPEVTITQLAPQTSCDPNDPNGRLQAVVTIGGVQQDPANFTFEWFVGQNTLPANAHTTVTGVKGSIAEKVKGGGQSYTVRATTALQCFDIADAVVTENLNLPVVTLTPTPNSICDPSLASSAYNGSVAVAVSFAGIRLRILQIILSRGITVRLLLALRELKQQIRCQPLMMGITRWLLNVPIFPVYRLRETAQIVDATVLPVVTASGVGSTNCTPALANGSALVSNVDGVGTGAPYTFQWHTGSDLSAPIAGATNATLNNRQGGSGVFFTVRTTNTINGCQTDFDSRCT